jgi:hypothetical protein
MKVPDSVARISRAQFQLARFEVVGDRCQVQGRWFGVRGRRFMRPTLTAVVDGQPVRLLADLADKPWTAEDGELWQATFPFGLERAQFREAELTVAPDVTITLPDPQSPAGSARHKASSRRAGAAPRDHGPRKSRRSGLEAGDGQADALARELAELRKAHSQLLRRVDRLEADKARTAQSLDEMAHTLRQVTRERDEANAARDRIAAELEAMQRQRDEVIAERDAARAAIARPGRRAVSVRWLRSR